MKHNNMIANEHFRKYWQRYVKTWFDQPAKKKARRMARQAKAAAVAPRPVAGALRSVVHPPTQRYNSKVRIGRGFSLAEIKAAGLGKKEAQSVGICVDHRRRNKSVEGQEANVQRLREYRSKLVVFPKHAKKATKGWVASADAATVTEQVRGVVMPNIRSVKKSKARAITADEASAHTVRMLKAVHNNARLSGYRAVQLKAKTDKAEQEALKKAK
jgi:large subunit ribosomal protein L13e